MGDQGGSNGRAHGYRVGIRNAWGFSLLSAIHGIDNGSRTVFLTYLPFLLLGKVRGWT